MIKELHIEALHGDKDRNFHIEFNEDLTLLSGKNGSGKTTILEIIWYALSPNVERIFREYTFGLIRVVTDEYILEMRNAGAKPEARFYCGGEELVIPKKDESDVDYYEIHRARLLSYPNTSFDIQIEEVNRRISSLKGSSLFFPTFRRLEKRVTKRRDWSSSGFSEVAEAMSDISQILSNKNHRYVASVSTNDIKQLITEQYASLSERALSLRQELLDEIPKFSRSLAKRAILPRSSSPIYLLG